jgi:hypothetical protein
MGCVMLLRAISTAISKGEESRLTLWDDALPRHACVDAHDQAIARLVHAIDQKLHVAFDP